MPVLKSCPFCNSIPKIEFDTSTSMYKIQCKKCKETSISLICEAEDMQDLIAKWNNRWFDNKLLLDKDEYQKFIDTYYYNLTVAGNPEKRDRKKEVLIGLTSEEQLHPKSYGYLIFDTGEVLSCDIYGHPELLLKRYGISEYIGKFDHSKFCANHQIVKVTFYNSYLTIDMPLQYSKKQIDACFETLLTCKLLKQMTKFSIFFSKTGIFQTFYTLDELLEKLDKL